LPSAKAIAFVVVFVVFLVVFALALVTYTRRVDGTSMLPTLEEGDLVVIQGAQPGPVHVGDIIVYGAPCSAVPGPDGTVAPVIHRVVATDGSGDFTTKGDNNGYTDQEARIAWGPITPDCVEGKVVFVVPYIERIASLPDGLNYIIAAIIILVVVGYEFWGGRSAPETPAPVDDTAS